MNVERVERSGAARLVLILSPERSGSTLLNVLLGAHSAIVAPPELHLLRFADFESWRRGYPAAFASLSSLAGMLSLPSDRASIESRFAGCTGATIYQELLRLAGPGRFLIDKTPGNAHAVENLVRAESFRPLYVWLVRHPLGVALSRLERQDEKRRGSSTPLARIKLPLYLARQWWRRRSGAELGDALGHWTAIHRRIESFLAGVEPSRSCTIEYESLVREPKAEIAALCRFLGVEPEEAMLDPSSNLPSGLQWGIGDEKIRTHARIDASSADRWRERYSEALLDDETAELWARIRSPRALRGATRG
jgi:hypothetical protein